MCFSDNIAQKSKKIINSKKLKTQYSQNPKVPKQKNSRAKKVPELGVFVTKMHRNQKFQSKKTPEQKKNSRAKNVPDSKCSRLKKVPGSNVAVTKMHKKI